MADAEPSEPSKRQNHTWTAHEDSKLVECLMELYQNGRWRADNGTFRSGYLKFLEKGMREKILGTLIKASPHIDSRFRTLKRQTHAIWEMISGSGFGWDDQEKRVICEKLVFDEWTKSHPNVVGLRGKSFPHYDELSIIFGKDRAIGAAVESFEDAVEEIEKEEAMEAINSRKRDRDEVDNLSFEDFFQTVGMDDTGSIPSASISPPFQRQTPEGNTDPPASESGERSNSSTRKIRRRRSGESSDTIADPSDGTFGKMEKAFLASNETLGQIANCFQHLANDAANKDKVIDVVMNLDDLSFEEKMMAGSLISEDANKARYLLRIAENMRAEYCRWVLKKASN